MRWGDDPASRRGYARLAGAHACARQPSDVFDAVAALVGERIGYGLLTMLRLEADGEHVTRVFTTDERHYPLPGAGARGSTAWGDHVLRQRRPYLGADKAAVRWAFPQRL